mmetsp:Transcript_1794/g.3597  ORF Transcript_1794/g.3597 Transcript_1794/m.3597 type:complete len:251 (+) Transcript_1794:226-978(+)
MAVGAYSISLSISLAGEGHAHEEEDAAAVSRDPYTAAAGKSCAEESSTVGKPLCRVLPLPRDMRCFLHARAIQTPANRKPAAAAAAVSSLTEYASSPAPPKLLPTDCSGGGGGGCDSTGVVVVVVVAATVAAALSLVLPLLVTLSPLPLLPLLPVARVATFSLAVEATRAPYHLTESFGYRALFASSKSTKCKPKRVPYPSAHSKLSSKLHAKYPFTGTPHVTAASASASRYSNMNATRQGSCTKGRAAF